MKYLLLSALLFTTPTMAETLLSHDEFEALSTGKTLYFSKDGKPYGSEHFSKDRSSVWRYSDGECEKGEWFPQAGMICFNYEFGLETQCWDFFKTDKGGYAARAEGAPKEEILELDTIDKKPLLCKGTGLSA